MGTTPSEREGFAETHVEDAGENAAVLPLENRDKFAQLATHGRLPGHNVELRFVPIHDLQRHRVTTFFCTPAFSVEAAPIVHGYKALEGVGVREMPFIDRAILAHAVKFARRLAAAGTVAAVGTSVHFETLAWSKGREIYQHALRAAGVSDYPFLVLNIEEIPTSVSAARLAEVVAAVRPYLKRIFLHLPDTETSVQHCGHLGVSGLTLSLPPRPTRVVAMGTAKWLMRECDAQTAHSCVKEIDSETAQEIMTLAGIRFGAGTALESREFHGDAHPADIEAYLTEAHTVENSKSLVSRPDAHLHA
jgi:hypothetical protein